MRIKLKNVVLSYYITGRYYHRHFRLSYNVVIYKKKNASKTVHVMSYDFNSKMSMYFLSVHCRAKYHTLFIYYNKCENITYMFTNKMKLLMKYTY